MGFGDSRLGFVISMFEVSVSGFRVQSSGFSGYEVSRSDFMVFVVWGYLFGVLGVSRFDASCSRFGVSRSVFRGLEFGVFGVSRSGLGVSRSGFLVRGFRDFWGFVFRVRG